MRYRLRRQAESDTVPYPVGRCAMLEVRALGRLFISYEGIPLHLSSKARDLLILLLLRAGEPLRREALAERLWPGASARKGRHALATAVWRLRCSLPKATGAGERFVLSNREALWFNHASAYWFDVQEFTRLVALGLEGPIPLDAGRRRALREALELYRGDFMEGCYDDWCLLERERLQLLFIRVLKRLQRDARLARAFEDAIAHGQQLLALDPLQEDVHRELMRCYAEAGQRSQALAQFQRCREALRKELGVDPMLETWRVYQRIRGGEENAGETPGPARSRAVETALACVSRALEAVEAAWQALQEAKAGL